MAAGAPRRGLGRGLGSLIPTGPAAGASPARTGGGAGTVATDGSQNSDFPAGAPSSDGADPRSTGVGSGAQIENSGLQPVDGAYFAELPVGQIRPNAVNPRTVFDEDAMAELVHSIREIGLLQPVVVRKTADDAYELVMGERRWRATQAAGLETIPAIVRETDDTDMLRDALLENLHRSNLNPLEEAAAYQQLLEDFSCTHEELAQRIGRSRPQISNTLRLLKLSPAVQRRVAAGVLSAGHARALLAVGEGEEQDRLAQRVVAEGISVRALEEIVALGDGSGGTTARPRRSRPKAPGLEDLSERLGDRLETRVKVDLGKSKGRITIEFANTGDLKRIVELIDPRNRSDRPI
ncbi:ParB/RepB/Spo0J family partition protein [Nocardioides sp. zg-ZUI104]|uniref:ParB/RepB/Spo0J family partition protein n=1 Tax=Nocardioides faecalis TaxID=2803858 RepID=UPI001BD0FA69|nr:ParB/RepB/Spo0J family partition protein [Nocardioides faecalis]MBS4753188.1 ParB/RepB/Spo0J family partition protein [Nocardioides faecalis]